MDRLFLIARIADQRVAVPADLVESVIELTEVTPVPRVASHIAGLSALRSRVITVIDSRAALGLPPIEAAPIRQAVVAVIDGHSYGLIADEVEDVTTSLRDPLPVTGAVAGGWRPVTTAMVEIEGDLLPLIDIAILIAGLAIRQAA
ncbi:chemotaxis protein CheW [Sphingomonas sp. 1P06PA]|uniref:chemotaxis protein CheW n=1 Tax=Sphingomonas sp. 1P06PA TaxID=554121 RepID=UPI0039A581D1